MITRRLHRATDRLVPAGLRFPSRRTRLFWWNETKNFGDLLSPLLVSKLFNTAVRHSTMKRADLLAIGSILEDLQRANNPHCPVVWGSGFMFPGGRWSGAAFQPKAVRGKLSRERVTHLAENIALGDPGLLTPLVFPFARPARPGPISVVPHYVDARNAAILSAKREIEGLRVIDVFDPVERVVEQIATSSLVLSSSLHGLIISDAFGVPNMWTPLSDQVLGGSYKFDDYYSTFDLETPSMDLASALENADELRDQWQPRPRLEEIQERLLASFPAPRIANSG